MQDPEGRLTVLFTVQSKLLLAMVEAVTHLEGVDGPRFMDDLRDLIDTEIPPGTPLRPAIFTFLDFLGALGRSGEVGR